MKVLNLEHYVGLIYWSTTLIILTQLVTILKTKRWKFKVLECQITLENDTEIHGPLMELEITILLFHDVIFPKHQAYCRISCAQNKSSFYYRTLGGHNQIFYQHERRHQPEPYSVTLKMEAAHSSQMPKKMY